MLRKRHSVDDEPHLVVRTVTLSAASGDVIGQHRHDWHQLIYVEAGLMRVTTTAGHWIAPPSWAVWAPAAADHEIRFIGPSTLRTLYISPPWRPDLPIESCALSVTPLLRELIVRSTEIGMLDKRVPTELAIADLVIAELGAAGPPPFTLREPTTAATIEAARLLTSDGDVLPGLTTAARAVGLGVRTLERRFRQETGLSIGRWRHQHLLLRGLESIAAGVPVKAAAARAGYSSPSAFIAAFRREYGTTPGRYL